MLNTGEEGGWEGGGFELTHFKALRAVTRLPLLCFVTDWSSRRGAPDSKGRTHRQSGWLVVLSGRLVILLWRSSKNNKSQSASQHKQASLRSTSALTCSSRSNQHLFTSRCGCCDGVFLPIQPQQCVNWLLKKKKKKKSHLKWFAPSMPVSLGVSWLTLMLRYRTACKIIIQIL